MYNIPVTVDDSIMTKWLYLLRATAIFVALLIALLDVVLLLSILPAHRQLLLDEATLFGFLKGHNHTAVIPRALLEGYLTSASAVSYAHDKLAVIAATQSITTLCTMWRLLDSQYISIASTSANQRG